MDGGPDSLACGLARLQVSIDYINDISCGRSGARSYARQRICKALGIEENKLWLTST